MALIKVRLLESRSRGRAAWARTHWGRDGRGCAGGWLGGCGRRGGWDGREREDRRWIGDKRRRR
jgi:hypothetical protein